MPTLRDYADSEHGTEGEQRMRAYPDESEEVKAFRKLRRMAERSTAAHLIDSPIVIDTVEADEDLKRAAMAYAATQETPKKPTPKRGGAKP